MLHKETVDSETLELLNDLMMDRRLNDFFLVGGTAMSLQVGHRISIDLDLFSLVAFDDSELVPYLEANYNFALDYRAKNTLKGRIRNVFVDFITHGYPLVSPLVRMEGIRMAGLHDIAAMKLNAIAVSGERLKDFIDVAYLSAFLSLSDMLDAYSEKYPNRSAMLVVKALTYYDDVNFDEPLTMHKGNYSWDGVARRLKEMIDAPDQRFDDWQLSQSRPRRR